MEERIGGRNSILTINGEAKCIALAKLVSVGRGWSGDKDISSMKVNIISRRSKRTLEHRLSLP